MGSRNPPPVLRWVYAAIMVVEKNPLEKYLWKMDKADTLDMKKMSPIVRTFLASGGKCTVDKWPVKDKNAFIRKVKENEELSAILSSLSTFAEQLDALNSHIATSFANFEDWVKRVLPDALACINSKTWLTPKDTLDEDDETEKVYIEVVQVATIAHVQQLEDNEIEAFVRQFAVHPWLSNGMQEADSSAKKITECLSKIKKRLKNKVDARKSRKRKRQVVEDIKSRTEKSVKLSTAARAIQDSVEAHLIRESTAAHNRHFQNVLHFFLKE